MILSCSKYYQIRQGGNTRLNELQIAQRNSKKSTLTTSYPSQSWHPLDAETRSRPCKIVHQKETKMEPTIFLNRLARTEQLYDQFRCPPFYVVPVAARDQFLRRTKMTEEVLNEAIRKFEATFPKSIWKEDFEGVPVYHVSTHDFSTEIVKIRYVIRR